MGQYLCLDRGHAAPLGATQVRDQVNFAIFSQHATDVWLGIFKPGGTEPYTEFKLNPDWNRTGNIWHVALGGLPVEFEYAYRMDRRPNAEPHIHRYDPTCWLVDPYAPVLTGGEDWGPNPESLHRRSALLRGEYDWGSDRPLNLPLRQSVIYELHVRAYTRHPSSGVTAPGTYLGLTEKIPYLKQLGITAVELLPVYEFEEANTDRFNPSLGVTLLNLWGYQPIGFFAPNASYATDKHHGAAVSEFREMVRRFHDAGIEVILDVVFNHTAEGDERGPTYSFRGIDNAVYYLLDEHGAYRNFSGCGNALNCNHPVVRTLITDCLRYWVMEMHVDGFRFDLASVLGRGVDGEPLANPPLLEHLAYDPVLANTKLIAEAWDAAGLYQVGSFPAWGRWAEWNGKYRDDLRRFVKSDEGLVPALAQRLTGSPDLYAVSGRQANHSINFITAHDGFTLADLVSYNSKHNEANGEENRDGANENYSWNCGAEGPSNDPAIRDLRLRQMRNFASLLFVSGGTPMILAGDEMARSQNGNNNAYCQDNDLSWINWELVDQNAGMVDYFRRLIEFRRRSDALRHIDWGPEIAVEHTNVFFHGTELGQPDWSPGSRSLAIELQWHYERLFVIANAYWEPLTFQLPNLGNGPLWQVVADTAEPQRVMLPNQAHYTAVPRSVVILEAFE